MDSPYAGYTTTILNSIDASVHGFTQTVFQNIVGAYQREIYLVLVLYIALFGGGVLMGTIELSFRRTVRHIFFMAMVVAIATHWDMFALFFNDVATDGPGKLINTISGGLFDPNALLSDVFDKGMTAANEINQNAGFRTMGFLIIGYSVFYATMIGIGFAVFLLALSKIALAILLGLAPLFTLLLLFPATKDYFSQYLRQIVTFALVPVFTSAILALFLKITQDAVTQLNVVLQTRSGHGGPECFFVIFSFGILFMLLLQVQSMASGVAGGLGIHVGAVSHWARRLGGWTAQASVDRTKQAGTKFMSGMSLVRNRLRRPLSEDEGK